MNRHTMSLSALACAIALTCVVTFQRGAAQQKAASSRPQYTETAEEQTKRLVVMIRGKLAGNDVIGAGIIFGHAQDRLYVVTANHVVRQGSQAEVEGLQVLLRWLPGEWVPARLLAHFDADEDLAVMAIPNARTVLPTRRLSFDRLASGVTKMDPVYAVGYPAGQPWFPRVTPDVVAEVTSDSVAFETNYLQQGHSGGALVNRDWQIVGLVKQDQPPRGIAARMGRVIERLTQWGYVVSLTTPSGTDSSPSGGPTSDKKRGIDPSARNGAPILKLRNSAEWPMFGYDAQHSHWNRAETTLRPPLKLLARFSIPGMTIDSLSAAAGRLFAGGMNRQKRNEVVALDAVNGKVVWSFTLDGGGAMDVTPLYVGGTVCVGGQGDDNLYALDVNTGKLKWRIPGAVSLYTNHPIVWGRIVYYVAISTLIALDPLRGSRLWSYQLPSGLRTQTSPVASGPYLAVVDAPRKDSDEGTLHIVDARTGSLVRRIGVPAQGITYPIAAEKNIIAASGREVACLNVSSGSLLWRTQLLRGDAWGAMLASSGTSVFVRLTQASGEGQGLLYSLDRDSGKTQWRFPTGGGSARRPVIANNLVYVTKSNPPRVVGVDMKMGKEVWGEDLLSGPTGDPIVAYGFLYVPVEGTIYVFG